MAPHLPTQPWPLREAAQAIWAMASPADKVSASQQLRQLAMDQGEFSLAPPQRLVAPSIPPGRPEKPELLRHTALPRRSVHTVEGRAALVHSIAHIEFNAINLALDAVWRFDGMPRAYYLDWLRVAAEEAAHFAVLEGLLQGLGYHYGSFAAHDGLWQMCARTAEDAVARMALVPRTLEARGLDATPLIQRKLRQVGTPDALEAVQVLDIILREEIGHVAIGNHWYRWLCDKQGLDAVKHYPDLVRLYDAPQPKPPLNLAARREAGFSEVEIAWLDAGA